MPAGLTTTSLAVCSTVTTITALSSSPQLDVSAWLDLMTTPHRMLGAAIGNLAARAAEATRRGAKWIVDTVAGLYRAPASG